jgi:hypothetical protein
MLLIAFGSVAVSGFAAGPQNMAFDRFAVQNKDYAAPGGPGDSPSLVKALERRGVLGIVNNLVPEIRDLLVKMEGLFHSLDRDRHRHVDDLNKILGHIKDTWSRAIDEMMSQSKFQVVDVNGFNAFMEKYKLLLDRAIRKDSLEDSDVGQFLTQMDHLYRGIESAYAAVYLGLETFFLEMNIPFPFVISWSVFSTTKEIFKIIPNDLFDTDQLSELMKQPKEMMTQLTVAFEQLFETLEKTQFGHFIPVVTSMIQAATLNAARQRQYNENKSEL